MRVGIWGCDTCISNINTQNQQWQGSKQQLVYTVYVRLCTVRVSSNYYTQKSACYFIYSCVNCHTTTNMSTGLYYSCLLWKKGKEREKPFEDILMRTNPIHRHVPKGVQLHLKYISIYVMFFVWLEDVTSDHIYSHTPMPHYFVLSLYYIHIIL